MIAFVLQGVSWSDFTNNLLQLAKLFALNPTYWHDIYSRPIFGNFPRRWMFHFLFDQEVSIFLCRVVFMDHNLTTFVSHFACGNIRPTSQCCLGVLSCADFWWTFKISRRWEVDSWHFLFSYVLSLCILHYSCSTSCGSQHLIAVFYFFYVFV